MPTDVLRILNMRFYAYHGVFAEEAKLGQRFEVDLELRLNLREAGLADDLKKSIDYSKVYHTVRECVVEERFHLVEALGEQIAERIAQHWKPASLTVRVRKPSPPIPGDFDGVEIELVRNYV